MFLTTGFLTIGLIATGVAAGCSDSENEPLSSADGGGPDAATAAPLLEPPPAGRGIQVTMETTIEAGSEVEHCQFVRTGDEELIVNRDEVRFTSGSHHVLLFATPYEEIPTENELGDAVDTSGVFDCSEGIQGFWRASGLIAASQSAEGQSAISFPEGVGLRVAADTILLVNVHYINATERDLEPQVFINLHTIEEDELEQEGGLLFWYNPFLKVPANGTSTMRAGCEIEDDIFVTNAQSHMHRRGVGYVAEVVDPDGESDMLYTSNTWEDVPVEHYMPNIEVAAGSRIDWACEYDNPEDRDVYQGPRSTDEMCMFLGSYYPRNDRIGFCMREQQPFFGAQWMVGSGSANCEDSFACITDAVSAEPDDMGIGSTGTRSVDVTQRLTDCLVAADPAVSAPLSAALGCMASAAEGQQLSACVTEIQACTAFEP